MGQGVKKAVNNIDNAMNIWVGSGMNNKRGRKRVSEVETVPQAGLHLTAKALNLPPAEETPTEQVVE